MPGDVILIAGKGHEKVQITREGTFPFDDDAGGPGSVTTDELRRRRKEMKLPLWRIAEFRGLKGEMRSGSSRHGVFH